MTSSFFGNLENIFDKSALVTTNIIRNPQVKELMEIGEFDMIMLDTFMNEALYGFGEYFKAPMVGISNFATLSTVDLMVGNISPISFIPNLFIQHIFEVTFWQRCLNLALYVVDKMTQEVLQLPHQRKIYKELFPNATLSFEEANRNFSLILLNHHFTLSFARPYVPNMIEAAGLHIPDKLEVLPSNIQEFLNDSIESIVYINFGVSAPIFTVNSNNSLLILKVFKDLNYKVIWNIDYLPSEVQNDKNVLKVHDLYHYSILDHPKVKLYITNGEVLSIIDAIYYAKPVLGIPMFADQHSNINNAIKSGYGLGLTLKQLNESKLKQYVLELLNNTSYLIKIKELSGIFHDQPMKPLEKAIYWIEYVLRHRGAMHLRVKGRFLNFWQFYNIDVILAYLVVFAIIVFAIWLTMKCLYFVCCKSKKKFEIKLKNN